MIKDITDVSRRNAGVVAGVAILIMALFAVVATDLTIGSLVVQDDESATAVNILASGMIFRIAVLSWLVIMICDVLAAWGLYIYFKPVNKGLSLLTAWFRLVYVAVLAIALLNYVSILSLLRSGDGPAGPGVNQQRSRVMFFLDGFNDMWSLGLVIFGVHILILGYLAYRSNDVPRIIGILLIFAFMGYLTTNLMKLLWPEYEKTRAVLEGIFLIPMLSEVALGLWLLIRGGKETTSRTGLTDL